MKASGKALPSSHFESSTDINRRRNLKSGPAPAPNPSPAQQPTGPFQEPKRFVSPAGPDTIPPILIIGTPDDDVRFLTSATTLKRARDEKRRLDVAGSGMSIVIYRRSNRGRQFRLWQVDPRAGAPLLSPGAAISFDLFRIPDELMGREKPMRKRRAQAVANVVRRYGQQPPPTNVDPR
jgi:hypothetical protein